MNLISKYIFTLIILAFSAVTSAEKLNVEELEKKALAGDVKAQFKLGSMYDTGNGVERNRNNAEKWYLLAAKNGYAEAQNSLGSGYQAEKRYEEARKWYEKAVKQGHPMATNSLGLLYDLGLGVPQSRQKGFEYYIKAASLGWAEAMWNIANMYGSGQLGEKNLYKACIWSFRAKKYTDQTQVRLNKQLNDIIPYLESTLSTEQYASCQEEANKWAAKQ